MAESYNWHWKHKDRHRNYTDTVGRLRVLGFATNPGQVPTKSKFGDECWCGRGVRLVDSPYQAVFDVCKPSTPKAPTFHLAHQFMNTSATILNSGIAFGLLACAGGIGWLLTVYCLWDKYDPKKDKPIHLASDIINATFAVITLVAVVNFAVNLSIKLPDIISNRVAGDIKQAVDQKAAVTMADEIIRLNHDGKLDDATLNEVIQRHFKGLQYVTSDGPFLALQVDRRRFNIERGLKAHVLP